MSFQENCAITDISSYPLKNLSFQKICPFAILLPSVCFPFAITSVCYPVAICLLSMDRGIWIPAYCLFIGSHSTLLRLEESNPTFNVDRYIKPNLLCGNRDPTQPLIRSVAMKTGMLNWRQVAFYRLSGIQLFLHLILIFCYSF